MSRQASRYLPEWVLLPLRLFLGITFVYAGLQKLTDPQYFNPSAAGYIGKQIRGFAAGSPIHDFLIRVAVPHAHLFGALVAYGELAIGIGTLLGLLLRPAALFGVLLSVVFFLSASWRIHPYFYGADIVFAFCWITMFIAGPLGSWLPGLDMLLVSRLLAVTAQEWRPAIARGLYVLLGVREFAPGLPANQMQTRSSVTSRPSANRGRQALRRPQESRRNFLWGLVTGGVGMLGLAWLAQNLHIFPQPSDNTLPTTAVDTAPTPAPASPSATPASGASATSTAIAQVSSVPTNSAVNFTIPSNGDPGVLIHLNNGKFVAYDATCTHAGCPVQYDTNSQHLICPCHGAEFDPANAAAVLQGPTNTPLSSVPINIDNATGTISLSNSN